ncbi:MAG: phospho-N-acetylmuramoyl-pentapeptide-transferase [Oscillospiraceae bacterium]|nr:phospho-N-acetylmuramoyl-pentapeptide-transferase [Oscillospiraceae bacterium]
MWLIFLACALSFVAAALSGLFIIPLMRKLNFGATIYEKGPAWQKSKNGTPIMGGFMFIIGVLLSCAVCVGIYGVTKSPDSVGNAGTLSVLRLIAGLAFAFLNGVIGFTDDYIKAVKKQVEGLNPKQKMVMQFVLSCLFLLALYLLGDKDTSIHFPFIGDLELGLFYYPLMVLVLIYLTNAVNLTDGVDGLCSSITVVFSLGMLVIFSKAGMEEYRIYSAALAGGCLGFLIWNFHPAKIFMGDTGSMFLGGSVCAMGFVLHEHVILAVAAIVYILEALSVVIQVSYFKITKKKYGEGRRIFKMTPIHHHFEKSGWSEEKIVIAFSAVTLLAAAASVLMFR